MHGCNKHSGNETLRKKRQTKLFTVANLGEKMEEDLNESVSYGKIGD